MKGHDFNRRSTMKIDQKMRGQVPPVKEPQPFVDAASGKKGWKVSIPGHRPLATPAVAGGRVFLGGGFGSYDFWAFHAATGHVAWHYQTEDDGPTAAAVAEDRIAFNTESCELEVLTLEGQRVWKHWLGDPLLSMPAIGGGRVFQAYPDSRADRQHYLACFDLANGKQQWRQAIPGEVITCPVLADGHVYAATLDGTLACFEQDSGRPLWQEARNATSAPAVWQGRCYFSQRSEQRAAAAAAAQQMEWTASKVAMAGTPTEAFPGTAKFADYLDHAKRERRSPHYGAHASYDSGVGFSGHKGDAKIYQAMSNLGTAHVFGVWSFQGSKPFVARGRLYSGQGDTVHCADPESKEVFWKRKLFASTEGEEVLDNLLTPPATVNGKLFLGTLDGRILCLTDGSGEPLWEVRIGEPILFQPAVSEGRVFVGTSAGSLVCLETGDAEDDGWEMWGAAPAHNGLEEVAVA
jgi:outer membrane protein assembly factor BamB